MAGDPRRQQEQLGRHFGRHKEMGLVRRPVESGMAMESDVTADAATFVQLAGARPAATSACLQMLRNNHCCHHCSQQKDFQPLMVITDGQHFNHENLRNLRNPLSEDAKYEMNF